MNRDDSFERELKGTLDELASDPAPEELLVRVAAIPRRERATRTGMPRLAVSFGAGLAAIAGVAAVLVVAAIVLVPRQSGPGPVVGTSPTPTTASPVPVTPPPSASVTPAPTGSDSAAIPSGFVPASVTFVSPDRGFLLGSIPCSGSVCALVAQTRDGGRSWASLSDLPTSVVSSADQQGQNGVSTLRFASENHGWAFGPHELWTTHDNGASWARTQLPGLTSESTIEALETSAGLVHAVVLECGSTGCQFTIRTSDVAQDNWHDAGIRLPVGAGPVPSAQLVLNGNAGWLVQNDRVVTNGARLANGTWSTWQPPCATLQGPVVIAAASPTDLVGACDVGLWANHEGERLFVSHDGGTTFTKLSPPVPVSTIGAAAAADASTAVVAGYAPGSGGASSSVDTELATTFDAGQSWRTTPLNAAGSPVVDLGFTTAQQGVLIVGGRLEMTRDGGQSWNEVSFAP